MRGKWIKLCIIMFCFTLCYGCSKKEEREKMCIRDSLRSAAANSHMVGSSAQAMKGLEMYGDRDFLFTYIQMCIRDRTYAGRLDKDSEGLLLMTNDGDLINAMMRARYGHEKEYKVTVDVYKRQLYIRKIPDRL